MPRSAIRSTACGWSAIVGGFIFFTDTHMRSWRILGGACHALLHLAAAFMVGWCALLLTVRGFDLALRQHGAVAAVGADRVRRWAGRSARSSSALYLFVSIRVFGRHDNEAFSSLRIQDFKQWLRLRIDAAGALTIYSIAIDRVPRRWRDDACAAERRRCEADDARATAPRLIDKVEVRG